MQKNSTLERIEKEVLETLMPQEQLDLIERLIHQLRESGLNKEKSLDLSELYGLGKGLWEGEDAQEYVSRLREDRV